MPVEQKITCPHCGSSSECDPKEGIDECTFVMVQRIPTTAPLYLIEGNAVADGDGEELDWEGRTYHIRCLSCGKEFEPPKWMKGIFTSDTNEIRHQRKELLERIKQQQEENRGQDKKA